MTVYGREDEQCLLQNRIINFKQTWALDWIFWLGRPALAAGHLSGQICTGYCPSSHLSWTDWIYLSGYQYTGGLQGVKKESENYIFLGVGYRYLYKYYT